MPMLSVLKAVAHPWLCDVMGHLTTRFYVGMFDDASYHLIGTLFDWNGARNEGLGWVDVKHVIEYRQEVLAGDLLEISGELVRVGGKSITARYAMTNLRNGDTAATLEAIYVLFDLEARAALTIPDDLRARAARFLDDD